MFHMLLSNLPHKSAEYRITRMFSICKWDFHALLYLTFILIFWIQTFILLLGNVSAKTQKKVLRKIFPPIIQRISSFSIAVLGPFSLIIYSTIWTYPIYLDSREIMILLHDKIYLLQKGPWYTFDYSAGKYYFLQRCSNWSKLFSE